MQILYFKKRKRCKQHMTKLLILTTIYIQVKFLILYGMRFRNWERRKKLILNSHHYYVRGSRNVYLFLKRMQKPSILRKHCVKKLSYIVNYTILKLKYFLTFPKWLPICIHIVISKRDFLWMTNEKVVKHKTNL